MFWPLGKVYFRMRRRGLEHLPRRGPVIVVANHSSFLDPGIVGSACPRKVHFLITRAMYDMARFRWFYAGMESIPVSPGRQDALSLRRALRALGRGGVVGVFPEGGRRPDGRVGDAQAGAALLAAYSGAPVVPLGICGAYEAFPPRSLFPRPCRVEAVFGPALVWDGSARDRRALAGFSRRMMEAVAALVGGRS